MTCAEEMRKKAEAEMERIDQKKEALKAKTLPRDIALVYQEINKLAAKGECLAVFYTDMFYHNKIPFFNLSTIECNNLRDVADYFKDEGFGISYDWDYWVDGVATTLKIRW